MTREYRTSRWTYVAAGLLMMSPTLGGVGHGIGFKLERPPAADIYRFPLRATNSARGASGVGVLALAPSPFAIAVTRDGHIVYDLELTLSGLRPAAAFGKTSAYVVWITTPELDRTEKLGAIDPATKSAFRISSMNKFIMMVTIEESADVAKRAGQIVLRGVSPSGLMQSFASHELFSNMPHE